MKYKFHYKSKSLLNLQQFQVHHKILNQLSNRLPQASNNFKEHKIRKLKFLISFQKSKIDHNRNLILSFKSSSNVHNQFQPLLIKRQITVQISICLCFSQEITLSKTISLTSIPHSNFLLSFIHLMKILFSDFFIFA